MSARVLNTMAREVTRPADFEHCQLTHGVRYCYYPAFGPQVPQWAVAVDGVLARLPRASRPVLTVRQIWDLDFFIPPLLSPTGLTSIGGAPSRQGTAVGNFQQSLSADPTAASRVPAFRRSTPTQAGALGAASELPQFALAVSTAEWATGLPTTGREVSDNHTFADGSSQGGTVVLACVPIDQARQSIALWLAAGATSATRSAFAQLGPPDSTQVGKQWIATVPVSASGRPSVLRRPRRVRGSQLKCSSYRIARSRRCSAPAGATG